MLTPLLIFTPENLSETVISTDEQGEEVKHVVMEIEFEDMVGTDAFVALNRDQKQYHVIRDAGTPGDAEVTVVETGGLDFAVETHI